MKLTTLLLASATLAVSAFGAVVIQSPVAVTGNTLGDNVDAPISSIIDHSSLLTSYTNGALSYNSYLAGDPQHDWAGGFYTSPANSVTGSISFDMGAKVMASAFALWFDPLAPLTSFKLFGGLSSDFSDASLLSGSDSLSSTANWAADWSGYTYGASSFSFSSTAVRYLRLDVAGLAPAPDAISSVTIGEVAFGVDGGSHSVPDTASTVLLGASGFAALVGFRLRRA